MSYAYFCGLADCPTCGPKANAYLDNEKGRKMLPKEHSADWVRAIEHAVSRIEATVIAPGQTPEQLRDAIRQRVKDIAAPTYVIPDDAPPAPEVTDAMVDAYLQANDAYWKRMDELPTPPNKWRAGTPHEATRESLRAALGVPACVATEPAPANDWSVARDCALCGRMATPGGPCQRAHGAKGMKLLPAEPTVKELVWMVEQGLDNLSEEDRERIVRKARARYKAMVSTAPDAGVPAVSDAAVLGWLNPDTGKTCSVDEKHSMERHQGIPGLHIAKGFSIALVAAHGVSVLDHQTFSQQTPMGGGETD